MDKYEDLIARLLDMSDALNCRTGITAGVTLQELQLLLEEAADAIHDLSVNQPPAIILARERFGNLEQLEENYETV